MPAASGFAILCPGQGTQHANMFDLARSAPDVASQLDQWLTAAMPDVAPENVLGRRDLLFSGHLSQPLIAAATLAEWEALRAHVPAPRLVAGYSVGELAACSIAGALAPAETVKLAAQRARIMQQCADAGGVRQGMLSLSGAPISKAIALAELHACFLAIENGPDTCIIGGQVEQLKKLQADAQRGGARAGILPVAVASHTPLMQAAAEPFAEALRCASWNAPSIPMVAGVDATILPTPEAIQHSLCRQLTTTIHWSACMDALVEQGVATVLELGPGSTLARMMQVRHPQIEARSTADFRTLTGLVKWLGPRAY